MLKRISMLFAFSLIFIACEEEYSTHEIEMNCTGVYIKDSGNEYLVCNREMLEGYEDGDEVSIDFDIVSECPSPDTTIVCMMVYPNNGLVVINSIAE